jgi:Flp pilus assembly pilin Flp
MPYRIMGHLHALGHEIVRRERGQGTVEYVALILLVAVVLAGVVAATKNVGDGDIGKQLIAKLKESLGKVK